MKKIVLVVSALVIAGVGLVGKAEARENITDWYIKDFQSDIVVNKDSTALITENITADCGNLPDKHGIFRVVPTQVYKTQTETIKTPVELISITDFNDEPLQYQATNDRGNHTVTWKIGDAGRTVQGINYYKITYKVKNVIRFDSKDFDEFYWNLNGNFWYIETDSFTGKLVFPKEVNRVNTQVDYYTGQLESKDKSTANYAWVTDSMLRFSSTRTLGRGEGITASVTLPKGIFSPYRLTSAEELGFVDSAFINWLLKSAIWLSVVFPLLILAICYWLWLRFGNDPDINPTVAPEFEIPEKLPPIEMGMAYSDGTLRRNFISAAIIGLAVRGVINIKETQTETLIKHKDYVLTLMDKGAKLSKTEQVLVEKLFDGKPEVRISELRNKFFTDLPEITRTAKKDLEEKQLLLPHSRVWQIVFLIVGLAMLIGAFFLFILSARLAIGGIVAALVMLFFSFLMPKRTLEGLKFYKRIQGFKLYMETAEKYRQQFNEKENIFERFLPYAIMFGMTGLWIKKMEQIYGQGYFATYHPVWFMGGHMVNFDARALDSAISSMSSTMASSLAAAPSGSGAGGGGFAGGGGGGGGGGGW